MMIRCCACSNNWNISNSWNPKALLPTTQSTSQWAHLKFKNLLWRGKSRPANSSMRIREESHISCMTRRSSPRISNTWIIWLQWWYTGQWSEQHQWQDRTMSHRNCDKLKLRMLMQMRSLNALARQRIGRYRSEHRHSRLIRKLVIDLRRFLKRLIHLIKMAAKLYRRTMWALAVGIS